MCGPVRGGMVDLHDCVGPTQIQRMSSLTSNRSDFSLLDPPKRIIDLDPEIACL